MPITNRAEPEATSQRPFDFVIYGAYGYIGSMVVNHLMKVAPPIPKRTLKTKSLSSTTDHAEHAPQDPTLIDHHTSEGGEIADSMGEMPNIVDGQHRAPQNENNRKDDEQVEGYRWAVAGRNERALREFTAKFKTRSVSEGASIDRPAAGIVDEPVLPYIVAKVINPHELDALCKQTSILVNVAGPHNLCALPLIEACIRNNTHYIDNSDEYNVTRTIIRDYNGLAVRSKVLLVTACGFHSIPRDLGALMMHEHLRWERRRQALRPSSHVSFENSEIPAGSENPSQPSALTRHKLPMSPLMTFATTPSNETILAGENTSKMDSLYLSSIVAVSEAPLNAWLYGPHSTRGNATSQTLLHRNLNPEDLKLGSLNPIQYQNEILALIPPLQSMAMTYSKELKTFIAPYYQSSSSEKIVRRSNALLERPYSTFAESQDGSFFACVWSTVVWVFMSLAIRFHFMRNLLFRKIPVRLFAGPSFEERKQHSRYKIHFVGTTANDKKYVGQWDHHAHPYDATAMFVGESALALTDLLRGYTIMLDSVPASAGVHDGGSGMRKVYFKQELARSDGEEEYDYDGHDLETNDVRQRKQDDAVRNPVRGTAEKDLLTVPSMRIKGGLHTPASALGRHLMRRLKKQGVRFNIVQEPPPPANWEADESAVPPLAPSQVRTQLRKGLRRIVPKNANESKKER